MKSINKKIILIGLVLIIILLLSFLYNKYLDQEIITKIIKDSNYAPILYILFVAGQVLLFPLPGQFAGLAGGYFFSIIPGTFYSIIGLTIGSYIAFYLSRKLGKHFVEKIDKAEKIKKFERLIRNKEELVLFLILLLPLMPDDLVSFIAGLTKIKTYNFITITILGRLPGFFFLNLIGSGMSESKSNFIFLMLIIIIISVILFIYKNSIENYFIRLIEAKKKQNK